MLYTKNGNNWQCSFQEIGNEKLLTHNGRRTTTDEDHLHLNL